MSDAKRVLVISTHDDDEVIGPGGTIRKLANAGAEITTLVMCNGNEGFTRMEEQDTIIERRVGERAAAQAILGTQHCIAKGHRDFENLDCESVYRDIIAAVRQVRPHLVLTHYPAEYIAHRTLAKAAPEAVWQAGWVCSLDLGEPWAVERIYQFSVLEPLPNPSIIIDITETFEAKQQAMTAYGSQHEVVAGVLQQIEGRARLYGGFIGVPYAEAFMRAPIPSVAVKHVQTLFEGV